MGESWKGMCSRRVAVYFVGIGFTSRFASPIQLELRFCRFGALVGFLPSDLYVILAFDYVVSFEFERAPTEKLFLLFTSRFSLSLSKLSLLNALSTETDAEPPRLFSDKITLVGEKGDRRDHQLSFFLPSLFPFYTLSSTPVFESPTFPLKIQLLSNAKKKAQSSTLSFARRRGGSSSGFVFPPNRQPCPPPLPALPPPPLLLRIILLLPRATRKTTTTNQTLLLQSRSPLRLKLFGLPFEEVSFPLFRCVAQRDDFDSLFAFSTTQGTPT